MSKFFDVDPDSFRGKVYLLAIDKVVIGALLALAFAGYSWWTKIETRAYEARLQETDLGFRRAEYVKELVPLVVDSEIDLSARAQALIALIETHSVGDKNALGLTERLLRSGLIRSDYPDDLIWHRDHPVLDALEGRMPAALESLLQHYMVSMAPDQEHPLTQRTRADIEEFWSELFFRTLDHHQDPQLTALNSDAFLSNYLWVMDRLLDRRLLGNGKAKEWFFRAPKGLRILAALRGVGEVGINQHALGREYLLTLVSPPHLTSDNLSLAGTVIRLHEERQWASKALATRCLEIVLREDEDMRLHPEYYRRSLAAGSYVEWYATTKRDESTTPFAEGDGANGWDEIQPALAAGLGAYVHGIAGERIEASDFGPSITRNSIALPLARILLDGIERGERPSEATRQVLMEVASLNDERLQALLLDRIDFRTRASKILAEMQAGNDR
jgi:hypothetical protein